MLRALTVSVTNVWLYRHSSGAASEALERLGGGLRVQYGTGSPCGTSSLGLVATTARPSNVFHPSSVQMIIYSSLVNGVKNMITPEISALPPTKASQAKTKSG